MPTTATKAKPAAKTDATKKTACWKDYKQIGMKIKDGRKVPNCVPKAKSKPAARKAKAA